MGLFDNFENRLEGIVNGVFVRAVKGDLKPVDVASALQRLLASEATTLSGGRRLAPNEFTVMLSKHDYDRLAPYSKTLNAEIIPSLREHAAAYALVFNGPISIAYVLDEELPSGKFSATAETRANVSSFAGASGGPRSDVITGPTSVPSSASSATPAASSSATPPTAATPADASDEHEPLAVPRMTTTPALSETPQPTPPRTAAASPHLALVLEVNGVRHPLVPPGFSIGRGSEADLRVSDPSISRKHAQIIVEGIPGDLQIKIVDLGSRNGIIVNGEKVLEAQLTRGSRIEIGSTRMLVHASHGES
jgi:hypothetical protein